MRSILFVLLVFFLQSVKATTYYFSSNSGDDSRSPSEARNSSTPWRSLSKLNSFFSSLQPGDNVLLKRGETFYGTIIVNKSGQGGSPITVGAYGSGNKPVITSLVTLSGWSSRGNGIWESSNSSLGSSVTMVLINGNQQEMGRYPNSNSSNKGYLMYESHSGRTSITDKQLTSSTNWTGAELVMRPRRWILDRCLITSHSGSKITYRAASSYAPYDNNGYFFQNSIKTLDKFGEWYYSGSSKKLSVHFGSGSPSSNNVQVASKQNLIFCERFKYIVFDNLSLRGSNESAVHIASGNNVSIESCDIQYSGLNGVDCKFHDNFKIENSTISNSNNDGINLGYSGDNAVIRNNTITNTALFQGFISSSDNNGLGILSNGNNNIIEYNQVRNTGYIAINFAGSDVTVKNNFVDGFCSVKDDGAGIYTHIGRGARCYRRKVIGNIILNGRGAPEGTSNSKYSAAEGFYADNNASDVEIRDNTFANNINQGIYIHSSYSMTISNNTLYNNNNRQLSMIENADNAKLRGFTISNNIVFSRQTSQTVLYLNSPYNDIRSFGKFSGNYYARPSDKKNSSILDVIHSVESGGKLLTYTQDVRFEYNATKQSKTIGLGATYTDAKNNKHSGSMTLQPFTSVVLIKTGGGSSNSSPEVSITSPEQNTDYSAGSSINVSADASDPDGSIKKVEFYSGSKLLDTETGSPYSFVWNNVSAGNYTITAKATDNSGNTTTSDGVSVTVSSSSNSSYPTVNLTSPTQNASYKTGSTVTISADASDADGSVDKVEFYNGSTLLHTETTSPFIWDWNNVSAGNYTITAKATDNDGHTTTSAGVSITVSSSSSSSYPTVSLTSPTQNASYKTGADINISAVASDDDGSVKTVQFYNGTTLLHTETGRPFSWDWRDVEAGNYTITAKATDNDGNTTTSAAVSISVSSSSSSNNPTISLTSPKQGASYRSGATINISASASDNDGYVKTVQFYNGSTLLHTETGRPYSWDWKNVRSGTYKITAKAIDNDGHTATSATVSISVGSNISSRPITDNSTSVAQKEVVDNLDGKVDYTLFPNPAVNTIKLSFDKAYNTQKVNVSIQNVTGSIMKSLPLTLSGKTMEVNISSLAPGVYIVRLAGDHFTVNKKFIKVN